MQGIKQTPCISRMCAKLVNSSTFSCKVSIYPVSLHYTYRIKIFNRYSFQFLNSSLTIDHHHSNYNSCSNNSRSSSSEYRFLLRFSRIYSQFDWDWILTLILSTQNWQSFSVPIYKKDRSRKWGLLNKHQSFQKIRKNVCCNRSWLTSFMIIPTFYAQVVQIYSMTSFCALGVCTTSRNYFCIVMSSRTQKTFQILDAVSEE